MIESTMTLQWAPGGIFEFFALEGFESAALTPLDKAACRSSFGSQEAFAFAFLEGAVYSRLEMHITDETPPEEEGRGERVRKAK